ncbi:hypothetical protein CICLE_v10006246mg [Citrus x clementina]|uniref:Heavy metal-associated isoprenylated plant protein 39 n=3 Tax=Citrus TaxID=2706 RepID=A0ACB8HRZ6_CITSI|nr:heavy metal-associated isoprenylated plant protein 39 [Citrus x clementina]ESR35286.1 hypothetical protein CICLE_v10006246mg [Citrus x clementina]KAH9677560.1 Heavy metal-associated isoprenylated plant protein 39 [Citrus sinensis]KDO56810.1 hypothetical protein CISIN_1g033568mg [Citrus sinensis]
MKKAVFKVGVDDKKARTKVLKTMVGLAGVDTASMDEKEKKLTVIGDIDLVSLVSKLKKLCHAEIVSVGPANKPEGKKKKDDDEKKKEDDEKKKIAELVRGYGAYKVLGAANACVIC